MLIVYLSLHPLHSLHLLPILTCHLISDFPLVLPLIYQSGLLLVPLVNLSKGLYLSLLCLYLRQVTDHRMQPLIGYHFIRVTHFLLLYPLVILVQVIYDVLKLVLCLYEGVVHQFNIQKMGRGFYLLYQLIHIQTILLHTLLVGQWTIHLIY